MRGSGDTIIIIWHAPFTLSGANSITYCVDIFDDSGKAITSVCNIRNTQYTFHLKLKKVTIVVTPANQVGRGMERNYTIINNNIHNNNINNNHTTEIGKIFYSSIHGIIIILLSLSMHHYFSFRNFNSCNIKYHC